MQYILLVHGNNGYAKARQCYVTRTLPVLLEFVPGCVTYLIGCPTLTALLRSTVYFKYLKTEFHPNHI